MPPLWPPDPTSFRWAQAERVAGFGKTSASRRDPVFIFFFPLTGFDIYSAEVQT